MYSTRVKPRDFRKDHCTFRDHLHVVIKIRLSFINLCQNALEQKGHLQNEDTLACVL